MGASIRPSLTVIDIRLKLRRAVSEMNRDIQIVISSRRSSFPVRNRSCSWLTVHPALKIVVR
jgi:hypothetical protein